MALKVQLGSKCVLLVSHRDQAGLHGVLVVLGVVPEGVQQLLGLQLAGADEVDGGEERELVLQALGGRVTARSWVVAVMGAVSTEKSGGFNKPMRLIKAT